MKTVFGDRIAPTLVSCALFFGTEPVGIRKPQAPFAFRCRTTRRKECKDETENPL